MRVGQPLECRSGAILLPPRLFPGAAYYALAAAYPASAMDMQARFDKRTKAVHRYRIADVRGPLELTVPIVRPAGAATPAGVRWADVGISAHGRWWEVHATALESAYGRTPFFEHYWPTLAHIFTEPGSDTTIGRLLTAADNAVRAILELNPPKTDQGATPTAEPPTTGPIPYWQVRRHTLGYIANLSILDLIFNLGPEAHLHLLTLQQHLKIR